MSSISNTLLQDALDTRDTHGGCISNGGWVLLTLANITSLELSNSSRFKSYDDLISHVQHCIGAGCEPLLSPAPAHKSQSASIPAPAEVGQGGAPFSPVLDSSVSSLSVQGQAFSFTELEAAQTALIVVRHALLSSQTTQEQCACMAAFAAQAQRVMQLSGRGVDE